MTQEKCEHLARTCPWELEIGRFVHWVANVYKWLVCYAAPAVILLYSAGYVLTHNSTQTMLFFCDADTSMRYITTFPLLIESDYPFAAAWKGFII